MKNTITYVIASLRVEDLNVLSRSTETKPNAANGVDQRVRVLAVDLFANTADIDIDDVGRWIKIQIPHVVQEHGARNDLPLVPRKILEQFEFARQ